MVELAIEIISGLAGQNGFFFSAWTDRRSGVPTEQIWSRRFRIPPISDPCSDPILTSAKITFNTSNDDEDDNKDDNTVIFVGVKTIFPGEFAAYLNNPGNIEFKAGSSHEFPFNLEGFWITRSRLQRGQVEIEISPWGNDTWKFNFSLDFTFTNGVSLHLETPSAITMSQDSSSKTIDISSMI